MGMPHTDLAILKDVRRKLEEAQERLKSLGDERHPNELEVQLQSVIDRVNADIEALQSEWTPLSVPVTMRVWVPILTPLSHWAPAATKLRWPQTP